METLHQLFDIAAYLCETLVHANVTQTGKYHSESVSFWWIREPFEKCKLVQLIERWQQLWKEKNTTKGRLDERKQKEEGKWRHSFICESICYLQYVVTVQPSDKLCSLTNFIVSSAIDLHDMTNQCTCFNKLSNGICYLGQIDAMQFYKHISQKLLIPLAQSWEILGNCFLCWPESFFFF